MEQNPQSQLKLLVTRGKEQGYLTYAEVNDHLPEDIVDSEQIEDIKGKKKYHNFQELLMTNDTWEVK